jgi:hypothetical protein
MRKICGVVFRCVVKNTNRADLLKFVTVVYACIKLDVEPTAQGRLGSEMS